MKRNPLRVLPPALLALAAGCAPTVETVSLDPAGRAGDVPVFATRTPECPYDELALVRASPSLFARSDAHLIRALQARARRMGGDALVGLRTGETVDGSANGSVSTEEYLAATVIRFRDPDCRR